MERRDGLKHSRKSSGSSAWQGLKNIRKEPIAKAYLYNHNLITSRKQQRTETRPTIKRIDPKAKKSFLHSFLVFLVFKTYILKL